MLDPINFYEIWVSNSFNILWKSLPSLLGMGHQFSEDTFNEYDISRRKKHLVNTALFKNQWLMEKCRCAPKCWLASTTSRTVLKPMGCLPFPLAKSGAMWWAVPPAAKMCQRMSQQVLATISVTWIIKSQKVFSFLLSDQLRFSWPLGFFWRPTEEHWGL